MHLAALRTVVHSLESMVEEAADGHPWGRGSFQAALALLTQEWISYRRVARTESAMVGRAASSLADAEAALEDVRAQLLRDNLDAARETLRSRIRSSFARVDGDLELLAASHVRTAERVLYGAQVERRRATRVALLENALSVVLAALLGALGIRAVQRHAVFLEVRASELEQFADRVAHDIRGPMSPALLALERGEQETGLRPSLHQSMVRGIRSLRVVDRIVGDLLSFARSGARPDPNIATGLQEVIDDVLSELQPIAESKQIQLGVEPFDDCTVSCSPGAVASIVANLVRNAITHMDGNSRDRSITVRLRAEREVRLEVQDTGPGMSQELAATVFEPRVRGTRTGDGLGLGLATVRRLVEAHGGRVGVKTDVGLGSTFWITLPRPLKRGRQVRVPR